MRIPTTLFSRNFLSYIEQNQERLFWNHQRISTAKRIQKPSDDPFGTSMAMKLRNNITFNDQYIENTHDALSWLNSYEITVDHLIELLTRVSELAVKGASDVISAEERKAIGNEVNQLLEELVDIANTKTKGKYIFGGTQTLDPPYQVTRVGGLITSVNPNPAGIDGEIKRKISENETITINLSGNQIFNLPVAGTDTFQVLIDLRDALYANDSQSIENCMAPLEEATAVMRAGAVIVGAKGERINAHILRMEEMQTDRYGELSRIEDTDIVKETIDLQKNELALQSALQIGARIIGLSLINFIR